MFGLDDLYKQLTMKKSEQEQCKREIRELEEKIEILKKFKSKVERYKYDIYQMYNPFLNYTTMCCDGWKGEKFKWLRQETCEHMDDDFSFARKKINAMLDRVCDEVKRLENKVHDKQGLLGHIQKALNSLSNDIEKLLN